MQISAGRKVTGGIGEIELWEKPFDAAPILYGIRGGSAGFVGEDLVAITSGVVRNVSRGLTLLSGGPNGLHTSDRGWFASFQPSNQNDWRADGVYDAQPTRFDRVVCVGSSHDGVFAFRGPATDWKVRLYPTGIEYPSGTEIRLGDQGLHTIKRPGETAIQLIGPEGRVPFTPLGDMSWVGYPFWHDGRIYVLYTCTLGHVLHAANDNSKGLLWPYPPGQYGQVARSGLVAFSRGAGEAANETTILSVNPADFRPFPGSVEPPPPPPEPPPVPEPEPINLLPLLQAERATYGPTMTNDQCVEMLNAVAWKGGGGWGLHRKDGGNLGTRYDGATCSVDWLVHESGKGLDCIKDAGGVSEVGWGDLEDAAPGVFVAPIKPQGGDVPAPPPPSPPPPPPPTPCKFTPCVCEAEPCRFEPTDLSEIRRQLSDIQEKLTMLSIKADRKLKGTVTLPGWLGGSRDVVVAPTDT